MRVMPLRTAPGGYRADIDGLRALAVVAVVCYHASLSFASGGFVGVDVFFVISGYLISSIIMRDIGQNRFSVLTFYERRIRRIFPAMLAMFVVVSAFAYRLLLPSELVTYGQSLLAALFSGSNFFFWKQNGYFDAANIYKPLLHTWSLSVEEQFYLLFPPFLLLLQKFAQKKMKAAIVSLAILSFAASALIARDNQTAAFYFTPLRAWELLIGTILSQKYLPQMRSDLSRNTASILGVLSILLPMHFYTEATHFPGFAAVPPCVGAALIIAAGEGGPSVIGRVLSWRPIVFIGLISYSIYLWHWPLVVFQTSDLVLVPGAYLDRHIVRPAILVGSIVLGYLSWRFIEQPFRAGKTRMSRPKLFILAGSSALVLSVFAGTMIAAKGVPSRYRQDALALAKYLNEPIKEPWRQDVCFISPPSSSFADYQKGTCLAVGAKPSLLLVGDSHAASLYSGLKSAFPDRNVMQATAAGCRALIIELPDQSRDCRALRKFIFGEFLPANHVGTLVLASRWTPGDFDGIGQTVAWAQRRNLQVFLIGPNPEFDAPLPKILARALRQGTPESSALSHLKPDPGRTDQKMAVLSRTVWHVPYVSFYKAFCSPDCPLQLEPQVPLTFDDDHLTLRSAKLFGLYIRGRVQDAANEYPLQQSGSTSARLSR